MIVNGSVMQPVRDNYRNYLTDMDLAEKDFSIEDFMEEELGFYKCEFYQEWYTDRQDMSYVIKEKYDLWVALDNEEEWLDEYGSRADRHTWF